MILVKSVQLEYVMNDSGLLAPYYKLITIEPLAKGGNKLGVYKCTREAFEYASCIDEGSDIDVYFDKYGRVVSVAVP